MTEYEAGIKWCPISAQRHGFDGNWDKGHCIGSRCMAWRWAEMPNPEWKPERYSLMQQFPPRDTRYDPPPMVCHATQGYCGLAGRAGALPDAPDGDGERS